MASSFYVGILGAMSRVMGCIVDAIYRQEFCLASLLFWNWHRKRGTIPQKEKYQIVKERKKSLYYDHVLEESLCF